MTEVYTYIIVYNMEREKKGEKRGGGKGGGGLGKENKTADGKTQPRVHLHLLFQLLTNTAEVTSLQYGTRDGPVPGE